MVTKGASNEVLGFFLRPQVTLQSVDRFGVRDTGVKGWDGRQFWAHEKA